MDPVIVIGASTGGPDAIREVITRLPADAPPVVIAQHMPAGFTRLYAERLNEQSVMEVREAVDGDALRPGLVLIAPGELQTRIVRHPEGPGVTCRDEGKFNGHYPSVEVLMVSAATVLGAAAIGIMLTGMGRDGALGLKAMRVAGARTLAQDEASSVVFGMPREAWKIGAAERLVPLSAIAPTVLGLLNRTISSVTR